MTIEELKVIFGSLAVEQAYVEAKEIQRAAYPDSALQGAVKEEYLQYTQITSDFILAVLIAPYFKDLK